MASSGTQAPGDALLGLQVVTLSEHNKNILFEGSLEASEQTRAESQAVLARLTKFDRTTAQDFTYKDKTSSEAPFRLLTDQDVQNGADSQEFESFIALSYCWHSDDWQPVEQCQLPSDGNGRSPISEIMLQGLLQHRTSSLEGIWIDALCIDQENEVEKRQAIGSMDIVYKSARLVLITLEDIRLSEEEEQAFQAVLDDVDRPEPRDWYPTEDQLRHLSEVLLTILSARWFTRAWCSHEFQLTSRRAFLIPGAHGLVEASVSALEDLYWHTKNFIGTSEDLDNRLAEVAGVFDVLSRGALTPDGQEVPPSSYVRPFMVTFSDVFELNVSIETDKIGIVINLTGLQIYFTGSEKSKDQCRWIVSLLALSASDASVLSSVDQSITVDPNFKIASWLRWSRDIQGSIPLNSAPRLPEQPQILILDHQKITLDLLTFPDPQVQPPTDRAIARAAWFIDHCLEDDAYLQDVSEARLVADRQSATFREKRLWDIITIACSLDCGPLWMARNGWWIEHVANRDQEELKNLKFDLWSAVLHFIVSTFPNHQKSAFDDEVAKMSLFHYIFLTLTKDQFLDSPSQYQSGLIKYYTRSDGSTILRPPLAVLDMGEAGRAITYAFELPKDRRIACAVPAALCGSSCATLRRLWLLEPLGEDSWRIIEKVKLYTYIPLQENGGSVVRMCDQKVYG